MKQESETFRLIALSNGGHAIVDEGDFEFASQWSWRQNNGYVERASAGPAGVKAIGVSLHRSLVGAAKGIEVDHIDCNPLNNRRSNLRMCTKSQNGANTRKRAGTSSSLKGVTWNRQSRKWQAAIKRFGKSKHLGLFSAEADAHAAYMREAVVVFGEFARAS